VNTIREAVGHGSVQPLIFSTLSAELNHAIASFSLLILFDYSEFFGSTLPLLTADHLHGISVAATG
jgi:hypothetical protein